MNKCLLILAISSIAISLIAQFSFNQNDTAYASSTADKILKKSSKTANQIENSGNDVLANIKESIASGLGNTVSREQSTTNSEVNSSDMISTTMKFGDKEKGVIDMLIYKLKDQSFIVGNSSRICPDQDCKFQFKDTDLVYQPGSSDITLDGTMKVDTGGVTKITKFFSRIQPTESREQNGAKIETVEGTFGIGKEPINGAEIEYNVNGTLESLKGEKTLSLLGVQCNGINNDNSKQIDCNY